MRRLFWKLATPFVNAANRLGWCSYEWVNVCHGAWRRDRFDELWHYERYGTPILALPDFVVLGGSGHRTAVSEGSVIFTQVDTRQRIAFERDPHERIPLGIWFVDVEAGRGLRHVPAADIDLAYRWIRAVFGGSFETKKLPVQS